MSMQPSSCLQAIRIGMLHLVSPSYCFSGRWPFWSFVGAQWVSFTQVNPLHRHPLASSFHMGPCKQPPAGAPPPQRRGDRTRDVINLSRCLPKTFCAWAITQSAFAFVVHGTKYLWLALGLPLGRGTHLSGQPSSDKVGVGIALIELLEQVGLHNLGRGGGALAAAAGHRRATGGSNSSISGGTVWAAPKLGGRLSLRKAIPTTLSGTRMPNGQWLSVTLPLKNGPTRPLRPKVGQNRPKNGSKRGQNPLWTLPIGLNPPSATNDVPWEHFGPWETQHVAYQGPFGAVLSRSAHPKPHLGLMWAKTLTWPHLGLFRGHFSFLWFPNKMRALPP